MNFLITSILLSFIGIFNVFGIKPDLFINQLFFFIASLIAYAVVKKIGRHFFNLNSHFFYWASLILLIITFVIGFEVKGSKRWINLYFFNYQASEFFKVFFILFLSDFLSKRYVLIDKFTIFLSSIFYFIIPALIIFKQPDLGTSLVLTSIFLIIMLFSELPKKYIIYFILISLMTIPLGWNFIKDYQRQRIVSFFNPHFDPQGNSYNMIQAVITAGSGQLMGRGLGSGTQSKLSFLPENHTDFAYSSMVEQFGFVGGVTVIILYSILVYSLLKRAIKYFYVQDVDGRRNFLYIIGFLSFFVFQIIVNIGMNLGLFPITGISLPFISYGGSSIVTLMIGLALTP